MRQVPASYLILGDGRVARHLRRYFDLEAISYIHWNRKSHSHEQLRSWAETSTHILLAISDSALEEFLRERRFLLSKVCVHFSGAVSLAEIPSAHPLMTFGAEFYDLEVYRSIPFVFEKGRGSASELLPGLRNPSYEIEAEKKALYHALCVLSGNFSTLLWERAAQRFADDLGLPKSALVPYMTQITNNIVSAYPGASVLTGPLTRGDGDTIAKNLAALEGDPFQEVYQAFVRAYSALSQTQVTNKGEAK
jgi:predicted short-subunit dehydrogenase-like oxidoreductase (DUF2520 family)